MATAIAKKKNAEVAIMDENMFAADAGMGVSDLGSEDLAIPFLKVLQKMSPRPVISTTPSPRMLSTGRPG